MTLPGVATRTAPVARRSVATMLAPACALMLLVTASCSSGGRHTRSDGSMPAVQDSIAAGSGQFANPVYADDFPDPAVILVGEVFYAYATQGGGRNIQTLTSPDLVHWTRGDDALPELGSWARAGDTWAPEVIAVGRRQYVMFYVARDAATGVQCIGRAQATEPAGPFVDNGRAPFLCQPDLGGSIDPNPVEDSTGRLYLYWKNDGNCCDASVALWGVQLTADAASTVGRPARLLTNTKPWQGDLIEAPEMVEHAGAHVLFYSGNDYSSTAYAIGYAICDGPLGPCADKSDKPLLASTDDAAGPGHCYPLTLPDGEVWMFFHAWQPDAIGSVYPGRELWLLPVHWEGATPSLGAPSFRPLAAPVLAHG